MRKCVLPFAMVLILIITLIPASFAATAPALPDGFRWVVEPGKYKEIYQFSDGLALAMTHDNKQVFIDTSGNVAISAEKLADYSYIRSSGFSDGLALVEIGDTQGFIDKTGKLVFLLDPLSGSPGSFSNGLCLLVKAPSRNVRYSAFMDKTGKIVISYDDLKEYNSVSDFHEGLAVVKNIEFPHDKSFIDTSGNIVINPEILTGCENVSDFSEGLSLITRDGKYAFIGKTGHLVISFDKLANYSSVYDFIDGYAFVSTSEKYGFIDKTGELVASFDRPTNYEYICVWSYDELVFAFTNDEDVYRFGYFDRTGKIVFEMTIKNRMESIGWDLNHFDFNNGIAIIPTEDGYGVIAKTVPPLVATPNASAIYVDGKVTAFDAYTINSENYIKLRDVAYTLNGTRVQFDMSWDGAANMIKLTSGNPYTSDGSEMKTKGTMVKTPILNKSKILLDGKEVTLTAYTIDGNNYFKLREVAQTFNFSVGWDGAKNSITVDTTKEYTP